MFLRDRPAMVIGDWLVLADLHVGIARELYDAGISIPMQAKRFAGQIMELKKISGAKRIVLLGDVKHKVPGTTWQELAEIPALLRALVRNCRFSEVIIIKGNHDGNIERLIPGEFRGRIKVRKSVAIGEYFLTHGHMKAKTKKNIIVIGHNQPAVRFRDEMGALYVEPVWVRGPLKGKMKGKELIILPAFNELRGHTHVNRDKLIGPIAKMLDKKKAHAYLLDGTDLGAISDLGPKIEVETED